MSEPTSAPRLSGGGSPPKPRGLNLRQLAIHSLVLYEARPTARCHSTPRERQRLSWRSTATSWLLVIGGLAWLGSLALEAQEWGQVGTRESGQIERSSLLTINSLVRAVPGSIVHWAMVHGFAEPESDGTWIVALEGALEIGVPDGADSLVLELYPYLPRGVAERTVAIRSGGGVQVVALRDGITAVRLKAKPDSRQRLSIECDFTVSPFVLGEGPDKRTLCVKLLSVEAVSEH